jgi:hypothetical protein
MIETYEVDLSKIDEKYRRTVKLIEDKPHVKYIRYLLTKRYSPVYIKKELFRLGLSAPHEPNLIIYYLYVIDPIIKKNGLGALYQNYKNKILRKNKTGAGDFSKNILSYRIDVANNPDMQYKFNVFVKELDIDALWIEEIVKYHGATSNLPTDDSGERILDNTAYRKQTEKILISPHRYLVDKMLLENVPPSRITKYCRENLGMVVQDYDITCYKRIFFNLKTLSIEDKLSTLSTEKKSLETYLKDLSTLEDYDNMDMGEKLAIKRQTEQRIHELENNIQSLNSVYSEFAQKVALEDKTSFQDMFQDIANRAYKRYVKLDGYTDRDVVDPMLKVMRILTYAADKVEDINGADGMSKGKGGSDLHSQTVMLELCKKRIDEVANEEIARANKELAENGIDPINENIPADEILGIEETGTNIEVKEEKIE